eukprot:9325653-Pyramimonas_sp.AAC.2
MFIEFMRKMRKQVEHADSRPHFRRESADRCGQPKAETFSDSVSTFSVLKMRKRVENADGRPHFRWVVHICSHFHMEKCLRGFVHRAHLAAAEVPSR